MNSLIFVLLALTLSYSSFAADNCAPCALLDGTIGVVVSTGNPQALNGLECGKVVTGPDCAGIVDGKFYPGLRAMDLPQTESNHEKNRTTCIRENGKIGIAQLGVCLPLMAD